MSITEEILAALAKLLLGGVLIAACGWLFKQSREKRLSPDRLRILKRRELDRKNRRKSR